MNGLFFPYKIVKSEDFGEVKIPVIKIFLSGETEIGIDAILDSGAIISVFPSSICTLIGLNFEGGKKTSVRTATGEKIPIMIHIVGIKIGDFDFKARIGFVENEKIPYILGRLDIFDKLNIRLEKRGLILNKR